MTTPSLLQVQLLNLQRVADIYTNSVTDPQGRIVGARLEDAHDFIKDYFSRIYEKQGDDFKRSHNYMAEIYGFARKSMLMQMFKEGQSLSQSGGSKTQLLAIKKVIHIFSKTWPRNAIEFVPRDAQPT